MLCMYFEPSSFKLNFIPSRKSVLWENFGTIKALPL
jgi:hypothetical protein